MSNTDFSLRPYGSTLARPHLPDPKPRPKTVTVDIHGHMRVPAADDLISPYLPEERLVSVQYASSTTKEALKKQSSERWRHLTEIEQRLEDMDNMAVDVMAVSCAPGQFYYAVDPRLGHESSQIVNDGIASKIASRPDRFVGLATVPLQDTDLAISELERAVDQLGFRGLQIGANVGEEELSAPRLDPFWAACQERDLPVFIHPTSFASKRLGRHVLTNVIGNPLDTTVAVHYLIFDGVMERFPDLKIILAHGGGFATHYAARMDHAFGARADSRGRISAPPSTYLKKFYLDSLVFAVDQLEFLVRKFGAHHILAGTDYPFAMGEYDPIEHVYQTAGLSETDCEAICGLNALSLLKLDAGRFNPAVA